MFTNVENVDSDKKERNHKVFAIKISTGKRMQYRVFSVDSVHNYYFNRFSPILTTSPAPIVINKSSFVQFSKRNFSISSKEGK